MQTMTRPMAVVQAQGSLNASNAKDFQVAMVQQLQSDLSSGLVVDMSGVESLDSAGLIALVAALKQARQQQKRFCLCTVPPSIRIIFELTQLDRAFEMIDAMPQMAAAA
ncbi:MAG: anti-sigma factor antagonist [Leptolyngbya sp. LCM1.Bin17]|nr:MAG: anti-sigma factor antagonist [Leptolyngbya sp. LCM1.Bin17]